MITCRHAHGTRKKSEPAKLVLEPISGGVAVKLRPYREVTQQLHITAQIHLEEDTVTVSYAICHPSDRFSRQVGITKAIAKMKSDESAFFIYDPAYRLNDYAEAGIISDPQRLFVFLHKDLKIPAPYLDSLGRKMAKMPVPDDSSVSERDIQSFNRMSTDLSFVH